MEYKANLITPSIYSDQSSGDFIDNLSEEFVTCLIQRVKHELNYCCKHDIVSGLPDVRNYEDLMKQILIDSEYALIIASHQSQIQFSTFSTIFSTNKDISKNRICMILIGDVDIPINFEKYPHVHFSLNNWTIGDHDRWIELFNLIKVPLTNYNEDIFESIVSTESGQEFSRHDESVIVYEKYGCGDYEVDPSSLDNRILWTRECRLCLSMNIISKKEELVMDNDDNIDYEEGKQGIGRSENMKLSVTSDQEESSIWNNKYMNNKEDEEGLTILEDVNKTIRLENDESSIGENKDMNSNDGEGSLIENVPSEKTESSVGDNNDVNNKDVEGSLNENVTLENDESSIEENKEINNKDVGGGLNENVPLEEVESSVSDNNDVNHKDVEESLNENVTLENDKSSVGDNKEINSNDGEGSLNKNIPLEKVEASVWGNKDMKKSENTCLVVRSWIVTFSYFTLLGCHFVLLKIINSMKFFDSKGLFLCVFEFLDNSILYLVVLLLPEKLEISDPPIATAIEAPNMLSNTGETCYLNAMMQALASSAILETQFDELVKSHPNSNTARLFFDVLRAINQPSEDKYRASGMLMDFVRNVKWNRTSQQDAFQLLSFFINAIHKEIGGKQKYMPPKIKLLHTFSESAQYNRVQDHLALALPLCGLFNVKSGVGLESLLDAFFAPSASDDGIETTSMNLYEQAPSVLILHIQANEWSPQLGQYFKPIYYIRYTDELVYDFGIQRKIDGSKKESITEIYQLTAVVKHTGDVFGGHYVAYRKHRGRWFIANDEQVEEIEFKFDVVPYIMVYEKRQQ